MLPNAWQGAAPDAMAGKIATLPLFLIQCARTRAGAGGQDKGKKQRQ